MFKYLAQIRKYVVINIFLLFKYYTLKINVTVDKFKVRLYW